MSATLFAIAAIVVGCVCLIHCCALLRQREFDQPL